MLHLLQDSLVSTAFASVLSVCSVSPLCLIRFFLLHYFISNEIYQAEMKRPNIDFCNYFLLSWRCHVTIVQLKHFRTYFLFVVSTLNSKVPCIPLAWSLSVKYLRLLSWVRSFWIVWGSLLGHTEFEMFSFLFILCSSQDLCQAKSEATLPDGYLVVALL